jgi:hypothetical protein
MVSTLPPFPGIIPQPIPGVELRLGANIFFVPPMLLRDLRASMREGLLQKIDALKISTSEMDDDALQKLEDAEKASVTLLHRSLLRNYPHITEADISDRLDASNTGALMQVVLNANVEVQERPTWAGPWGPAIEPTTDATTAAAA